MKKFIILFLFLFSVLSHAADLNALSGLFQQNFDTFYRPRLCGQNISRLIFEATKKNIDLTNSYVLKIEGEGFLETSGFYTRKAINEREMLGYFHFVLVADGYVFDFDLAEPLILKLEDYIRLQFTPAYEGYTVFGIHYRPLEQLPGWTVGHFELKSYMGSAPQKTWSKRMDQIVDLKKIMKKKRIR
jgi:hypothetical protein